MLLMERLLLLGLNKHLPLLINFDSFAFSLVILCFFLNWYRVLSVRFCFGDSLGGSRYNFFFLALLSFTLLEFEDHVWYF